MEEKKNAQPRGHHFLPACWLAGFTESGDKDDRIWVTDFSLAKQWKSEPTKAGRIRDFYRIDHPNLDPAIGENSLSQIEDAVAPVLKALDRERREPNNDELDALMHFMAIQFVRIPSFRPFALSVLESVNREELAAALKTPETWMATLREAGIAVDAPGADYERACEEQRSGKYLLGVDTTWYMKQLFRASIGYCLVFAHGSGTQLSLRLAVSSHVTVRLLWKGRRISGSVLKMQISSRMPLVGM